MIKVTGMAFTPIHDFLPAKVPTNAANGVDGEQVIDQRFIALANSTDPQTSNYADIYQVQQSENDTTDGAIILEEGALTQ